MPEAVGKFVLIMMAGAADEPIADLDGATPLQSSRTSHMDWIATNGRQGRVVTIPRNFRADSDVATLSLLGYDPGKNYCGRGPLEAIARGVRVEPEDVVFRCNFVTVTDGHMEDYTAGNISNAEAQQLVSDLNERLANEGCRFFSGRSYRNLMVCRRADCAATACTPPQDIPDRRLADYLPHGDDALWIERISERARDLLADHDVNQVRMDLQENPATDIWLWGQGWVKPLASFASKFHIRGAVVTGTDYLRGLAIQLGLDVIDVEGATGTLDTDYAAKGRAAVAIIAEHDLVVVHVGSPDVASHQGDLARKISAIEQIDEHVVGPLLDRVREFARWKIMVVTDHPTPVQKRVHTSVAPPFCLAGHRIQPVQCRPFSEQNAERSDLQVDPGHELMEYFLRT